MAAIVGGRLLIDGLSGDRRESLAAEVIAGRLQLALAAGGTHVLRSPEHHAFTAKKSGNGYVISGRMPVVLHADRADRLIIAARRSEEPTSELQSLMPIYYAVFCIKK